MLNPKQIFGAKKCLQKKWISLFANNTTQSCGTLKKTNRKKEEAQQQKVIPDSNKSDGRDESDDYDDDDNDDDDITVNITTKFVAICLF